MGGSAFLLMLTLTQCFHTEIIIMAYLTPKSKHSFNYLNLSKSNPNQVEILRMTFIVFVSLLESAYNS